MGDGVGVTLGVGVGVGGVVVAVGVGGGGGTPVYQTRAYNWDIAILTLLSSFLMPMTRLSRESESQAKLVSGSRFQGLLLTRLKEGEALESWAKPTSRDVIVDPDLR